MSHCQKVVPLLHPAENRPVKRTSDTHSDVQQTSDGLVVPGTTVSHTDSVHSGASQDGVLRWTMKGSRALRRCLDVLL